MKTYTETKKAELFNWKAFLNRKPETITEREWLDAKYMAASWVTCACGNQCDIIPRYESNSKPIDDELATLGGIQGFYGAIERRNLKKSKEYLKQIEIRSKELIKIEVAKAQAIVDEYKQYL